MLKPAQRIHGQGRFVVDAVAEVRGFAHEWLSLCLDERTAGNAMASIAFDGRARTICRATLPGIDFVRGTPIISHGPCRPRSANSNGMLPFRGKSVRVRTSIRGSPVTGLAAFPPQEKKAGTGKLPECFAPSTPALAASEGRFFSGV